MLFNSFDFAIFLPCFFLIYWFVFYKNLKWQNAFIVISSYLFYGWWDYRFLSLIAFSTLVDYLVGINLNKSDNKIRRKILLIVSLVVNLGLLGFFKYYNFFVDSFADTFRVFGREIGTSSLYVILPVGISFYTFQTLSYTIDIYRKKISPTKDLISFAAFVSFFPQLVAGPIERASNFLPQFFTKRKFDYNLAVDGLKQMLWGFFKKMVIADRCAEYANFVFNNSESLSGGTLILGVFFFAFQIYGDFSGYSDIAIGTAKLFGFNLKQNFAFPYFSRDIAEFWRRWHISLTSWFRDYVYIPLGGSRKSKIVNIRNVIIVFVLSGFWHGANWTFVIWGLLNAVYFIPLLLLNKNRKNIDIVAEHKKGISLKELGMMIFTFLLTLFAWIFFRAESINHAVQYISTIFSETVFVYTKIDNPFKVITTIVLIIIFIYIEWIGRRNKYAIECLSIYKSRFLKWMVFYLIVIMIFVFGGMQQNFIYFQF
ncbi:MAG TPA: MBOAT family O-acyltransferase [Bacteroidales bacterium]|nr:MBOAT family O-acyltransferase [Bacteroidales bacterium]